MPVEPIPFTNSQASGNDPLGGAMVVSMNTIREPTGAVRRRPGVKALAEAPTLPLANGPVTGLFATQTGELLAVVDVGVERPIYRIAGGAATALGGGVSPFGLLGAGRPVFAETEMLLVLAGGSNLQKVELATLTSSRLGGSPPVASHVAALTSRLVANDLVLDKSKARFSDVATGTVTFAGHEVWSAGIGDAGVVAAEGRPDPVLAVFENTVELFLFGSSSLQIFTPDTELVFAPVSAKEYGIGAPYSVVRSDDAFFWIDQKRRIPFGDGRSYSIVSDQIKGTLDAMSTVTDAYGYRVLLGPLDAVVWSFPSSGKTLAYQKGSGWGQWQGFDGNWTQFPVTSHVHRFSDGKNIVGLSSGRVGELSFDAQTDLGAPINNYIRTGYLNRGSDMQKHCQRVRLALRRGEASGSTAPQGFLRFRDREGPWTTIPITLGRSGDTEIVVQVGPFGIYRRRQWEFEFSGEEALVLLSATEEFTLLEV